MITEFDPSVNELFFARRVVLLEGDTEFAIFPLAASLLKVFEQGSNKHKKRDTTLINCRSHDSIPSFQRVLNHFSIPYVVVHDLEGEKKDEGVNGKILGLLNNNEEKRKCFDEKIEDILGKVYFPKTSFEERIKQLRQWKQENPEKKIPLAQSVDAEERKLAFYIRHNQKSREIKIFSQFPDFLASAGAKSQRTAEEEGCVASKLGSQLDHVGMFHRESKEFVDADMCCDGITACRAQA
jgi:predicted ATP-dependent endonuclease of OLD family